MSAFNAYHYIALGCAAIVLFVIIQYFSSALITFVRSLYKGRASRKHAVERLRNLPRGEPLEPLPAVSPEIPLPVSGEVPPTLEHAEPLEVQPAANAEVPLPVGVEVQPIPECAGPLEVEPAASAAVPLPANAEVQPVLECVEPRVQPAVSTETPAPVSAEAQPILEPAEPLEVEPAVSLEVPRPVSAEVEPVLLERAEPLYSGSSQLNRDSIDRQNILDALIVDQLTDAVTHGLSEVQQAVSPELPLPVSSAVQPILEPVDPPEVQPAVSAEVGTKVEPILEYAEPLEVQPAVSTEVPLPVGAEVQPILEHAEPLEVQSAASAELSLPVCAKVEPILERAERLYSDSSQLPLHSIVQQNILDALIVDQLTDAVTHGLSEVQPAVSTEVPLALRARVQPILEREEPLEPQPAATQGLPLRVGSKVWAVCKLGSVPEGTPGIITGIADGRFFWQSPTYLCTFADNRKVRARPKDIEVHNHGHSLQELEHPNLGSILSRRMTLRAQQLLSRQRPTHLPLAGKTKVPNKIAEINTGA
jgi:hypothetical protein